MKSAEIARRYLQVSKYEGTNERMNALMDGETVWIVQGPSGRRPIIADTEQQAEDEYVRFYLKSNDLEEDEVE